MASDDLHALLSPLLAADGLELFDVEVRAGLVRVTVDRPGGVDLDALATANATISAALEGADPVPGRYNLEVSSPGVERRLRTPSHFQRAVGETVTVRTLAGAEPARRVTGRLVGADDEGFEVEGPDVPGGTLRLGYDQVERVRTVFEWGARPASSPSRRRPPAGPKGPSRPSATTNATTERVTTP